ncbi:lytic transglycosylase domain-containing protein [Sphingomonas sanguinis]|uniref:lytic transglycosylase domain-containing protein n=1 Tax=Sphingomonas sanguinis TaxID=33051 RepID=UPI001C5A500E|nr:lytic transglycosylase domain-containing protein [Sphingomonas sanguinis]QXT34395.1 lytic transglycosylase domain-containing protein [Sphingomonas sanguinis]
MGTVRLWITAASAFHAGPVQAETVADWRPYIVEASNRFGVPTAWIERVMQAESGGRTMLDGRAIRSSAGAMGLMQLMPSTWADMRARLGLGDNPDDPRDNILAGTLYLRLMYDRFGYPGLFAAYNAGPGRYANYLAGHARLPIETAAYLARVAPPPSGRVPVPIQLAPPPSLFAVRRDVRVVDPGNEKSAVESSIFVALSKAD